MHARREFLITALITGHVLSINGSVAYTEKTETAMEIDINEHVRGVSSEESLGIIPF